MSFTHRLRAVKRTADQRAYVRELEARNVELEARVRELETDEFSDLSEEELNARLRTLHERIGEVLLAREEEAAIARARSAEPTGTCEPRLPT
jgi:hypothetical protein